MTNLTPAPARIVCFDPAGDAAAAAPAQAAAEAAAAELKFSQNDLNRIAAEEKRRGQAQLQRVQQTAEQVAQEKAAIFAEKEAIQQRLEALENEKLTAEQRVQNERKQAEERQAKETLAAREDAKRLAVELDNERLDRGINEAVAASDAFSHAQLYKILRPDAKLVPQAGGRPVVVAVIDDIGDDGVTPVRTELPIHEAIKKMKELSANANLWRSGVVGGAGANSIGSNGRQPLGPNGTYTNDQLARMTPAQYAAERAKNPQAFGIHRKKR